MPQRLDRAKDPGRDTGLDDADDSPRLAEGLHRIADFVMTRHRQPFVDQQLAAHRQLLGRDGLGVIGAVGSAKGVEHLAEPAVRVRQPTLDHAPRSEKGGHVRRIDAVHSLVLARHRYFFPEDRDGLGDDRLAVYLHPLDGLFMPLAETGPRGEPRRLARQDQHVGIDAAHAVGYFVERAVGKGQHRDHHGDADRHGQDRQDRPGLAVPNTCPCQSQQHYWSNPFSSCRSRMTASARSTHSGGSLSWSSRTAPAPAARAASRSNL